MKIVEARLRFYPALGSLVFSAFTVGQHIGAIGIRGFGVTRASDSYLSNRPEPPRYLNDAAAHFFRAAEGV